MSDRGMMAVLLTGIKLRSGVDNMQRNLVDYYVTNIQTIYDRIKRLYHIVNGVFMDDLKPTNLKISPPENPSGLLTRAVYLWSIQSIDQLQNILDEIVGVFNGYNLIDWSTGDSTSTIDLWRPLTLIIDETYYKQLSDNFERTNKLLDQLEQYVKPYEKGVE